MFMCNCQYLATDKLEDKNWTWTNYVSGQALAQAENIRSQLQRTMERFEVELLTIDDERKLHIAIQQTLVCGFFMQVAHKEGEKGSYLTVKDNQVGFLVVHLSCILLSITVRLWAYTRPVDWIRSQTGSSSMNLS